MLGKPVAQPRIALHAVDRDQVMAIVGAALASVALTWLLYERILPLSGPIGFWLVWYVGFVIALAIVTASTQERLAVADRVMRVVLCSAAVLMISALTLVIGYIAYRGWRALHPSFFTQTMATTGPLDPLSRGGAYHAMIGTLEQVAIAVAISVPLGITTALYLNEVRGRLARVVRIIIDTMSAIPSVVAGLFVLAILILTLGYQKSGLAAAIAISIEMIPVVTRTSEVVFRLVPGGLREASHALGASQWRTVRYVVVPTARAGLVTAAILGTARGIGETAPVLLVSGFTAQLNDNPLHGPQVSLPLYIYTYVKFPQQVLIERAFGAALVLLTLVLILFVTARILGGRRPGDLSRRQQRRIERAALVDVY
jgi:phosphate transport system permease protein